MPVLKSQRSRALFKSSKPSKKAMRWLYLSFVLLSLLAGMSLTGCASNSQALRECPELTPIESLIDVSEVESKLKSLRKDLQDQLNSAQKITGK